VQREALAETIADARPDFGAFANTDDGTGNLERTAIDRKRFHDDSGIGLAVGMPGPETCLEVNRQSAISLHAGSRAVVVDSNALGQTG
jgi:hypothetical protein